MYGPGISGELVIVTGRDHLTTSGGLESYVYAHALAARLAGYRPTIICASKRAGIVTGDFGTMIRVRTPVRPVRSVVSVLHSPWLVRAVVRVHEQLGRWATRRR